MGTEFGNIIARRYLQNPQHVKRATTGADRQKFLALRDTFLKYGEQYSLDYLLMMAKGYQESRLNQDARSRAGAIGIMQIMPATGRAMNVGDIRRVQPNIHAGVKYSRHLMDEYLGNEPMDDLNKGLFTLASYNAGPSRVRQLRNEAARRDLDPNVWFGNVEQIASERIGGETVSYVSNIYKYYLAYRLVSEEEQRRAAERDRLKRAAWMCIDPLPRHGAGSITLCRENFPAVRCRRRRAPFAAIISTQSGGPSAGTGLDASTLAMNAVPALSRRTP
jgi:membrane-bound lytic murein transglycosylase MltF